MSNSSIVQIKNLSHAYGARVALDNVSLNIQKGEIFGLLGPNGGGKTTLFRILSTLIPVSADQAFLFGNDLAFFARDARKKMGVIFQSPSLDKKLTVAENLRHQGHLYGLSGKTLDARITEMLQRVGLEDRRNDFVEKLSGGLQRRVDLAKAFLHRPPLLLLDEPSTGLDPGARKDLWDYLGGLKRQDGVTLLVTTHLMDEAERCDHLGILDRGRLVALDTPDALRSRIDGEVIIARSGQPDKLGSAIRERFGLESCVLDGTVRLEKARGHDLIPKLMESFPGQIDAISIGKPTLEDVFIQLTGHRFWNQI